MRDAIGAIVAIRARGLLTGFPIPLVILRIPPSMYVFLVFGVPGVLSACAGQGEWCSCRVMGTLFSERQHQ